MARTNQPQLWQTNKKRRSVPSSHASGRGATRVDLVFLVFLALALERGAEDVAERGARIGGAVLGDRLLLLRHFERLDRHLHLAGAAVELRDPRLDLLADREALPPLLPPVARHLRALDEAV